MNLRTAMKRFKSMYGPKAKGKAVRRMRVQLPEERDAKLDRRMAKGLGMKLPEYLALKKKRAEAKKYGGRGSGRFRTAKARNDRKAKKDYSPGSGNYYRG